MTTEIIRIGTRGSALALWQANHVKARLEAAHEGLTCELTVIRTRGDAITDRPLSQVGGKGLFVKEIEEAMLAGEIDLAVHSLKDMPSVLPDGLMIGAVPERANPLDAWVRPDGAEPLGVMALPRGAVIGTSSLRRVAQLKVLRPDIETIALRGNVDTRLRKLDAREGGLEAIMLACAGLERLGLGARVTAALPASEMLPAVGQGALAIEVRAEDPRVAAVVAVLEHAPTRVAVTAERALLAGLEGSCQIPIAGHARVGADGSVHLEGLVADPSGAPILRDVAEGPAERAHALGAGLAERLLENGGRAILARLVAAGAP
ncbi:MAG: hydroxymethylbilane synthase [Myxococcales bacterium]|nr:hydroxymethylbilane synthase [Myxococcales bacterium]MCB9736749.1 hydroxymethylbilane synthase [Deltaproteobacteria bacterium]